jgi:protein phosphatase
MLRISFFGKTDVGLERENNEDTFAVSPEHGFCLVADGMGGEAAGEVASLMFAEAAGQVFSESGSSFPKRFADFFGKLFGKGSGNVPQAECRSPNDCLLEGEFADTGRSEEKTLDLIRKAFDRSNKRILDHAKRNPHLRGMGCTGELLAFHGQGFVLGHIGDSRIYRFGNGRLEQITHDHSLVQKQLDEGMITSEEARTHSQRNIILKAVGIGKDLEPDHEMGDLEVGDLFLLCSDGLTDPVDDTRIREVLSAPGTLPEKTETLIEMAKSAGGNDNITVVLCEILAKSE